MEFYCYSPSETFVVLTAAKSQTRKLRPQNPKAQTPRTRSEMSVHSRIELEFGNVGF